MAIRPIVHCEKQSVKRVCETMTCNYLFASERVPILKSRVQNKTEKTLKPIHFIAVCPLHHSMGDQRNCIEWNVTKIHSTTWERERERQGERQGDRQRKGGDRERETRRQTGWKTDREREREQAQPWTVNIAQPAWGNQTAGQFFFFFQLSKNTTACKAFPFKTMQKWGNSFS